ncbi:MAG: IS630 transposase-related protein [Terrisporobacter sp.]|uniref:helix-turn-helix domain-containing protein n=1 Tax=Terrisporobacter sp. TaxID=1965305 RepID=UPI002A915EFA|nr:IS630 transposase-related protein [Terrisporobacter sp.]MDY6151805.1 IS630 transposase-related protein [Terrisporobacter sp.]
MNIITKEQSEMIDLILLGHSITDIAKNVLKLHPSTLYSWLHKDTVVAELEERRKALRKAARDKITGNVNKCLDNMLDLANNSSDTRIRFQANKYILDQAIGIPKALIESVSNGVEDKEKDVNTLKKEIENLKLVK